jgi:hypothetical protein
MNSSWCLCMYVTSKICCAEVSAFDSSLFTRNLAMDHLAWDVISELRNLVSRRSSIFQRIIRVIVLGTQWTSFLFVVRAPLVACHNYLSPCLCFNKWSKPSRSLFRSETITLLVDNTHIYIYIYIFRERERERESCTVVSASFPSYFRLYVILRKRYSTENFPTWTFSKFLNILSSHMIQYADYYW